AVRRRAEAERLEEEAELLFRFLVGDAHRGEDPLLHVRVVQADRAAADLESVQHQVVAVAEDLARIGLEILNGLIVRPRERVVRASGVIDFAIGLCVHSPLSPTLARARPFAPMPLAISSSLSVSVREKFALAGTFSAFTMPETFAHIGTPPPLCFFKRSVRSTCCIPKRRSGLSLPYSRIDCSNSIRGYGFGI